MDNLENQPDLPTPGFAAQPIRNPELTLIPFQRPLTTKDAANMLGLSVSTVAALVAEKRLVASDYIAGRTKPDGTPMPHNYRFQKEDVEIFLRNTRTDREAGWNEYR